MIMGAILLFVISFIAGILGFYDMALAFATLAKAVFFAFITIFMISFVGTLIKKFQKPNKRIVV